MSQVNEGTRWRNRHTGREVTVEALRPVQVLNNEMRVFTVEDSEEYQGNGWGLDEWRRCWEALS